MKVTVAEAPPSGWDDWMLEQGGEAGFCQSTRWAEVTRRANGHRAWFVEISDGRPLVRALVTQARPPRHLALLPRTAWPVRVVDGPVLADGGHAVVPDLLALLRRLGGGRGGAGVSIEPGPRARRLLSAGPALEAAAFERRTLLTSLVPLDDLDAGWAALDRAVRKNVARCRREGVEVFECLDVDEFRRVFAPAYRDARAAAGNPYDRRVRDEAMLEAAPGHYRFFVARRGDEPLATLGTYRWGDLVTEIASGRTTSALRDGLPVQDLLHWHVLEQHASDGAGWFDLAGFEEAPASPKEAGIRRFKEKWGGTTCSLDRWVAAPADPLAVGLRRLRGR